MKSKGRLEVFIALLFTIAKTDKNLNAHQEGIRSNDWWFNIHSAIKYYDSAHVWEKQAQS